MRIHEDAEDTCATGTGTATATPNTAKVPPPIVDTSNLRSQRRSELPSAHIKPPKAPSQLRTTSSHFLSDINVYDCCDFRAIPDPPTPEPHLNKRRTSTSMLPGSNTVTQHPPQIHPLSGKRSRKSLCHVPSPLLVPPEERAATPPSPPPASLQVHICLDDGENDDEQGAAASQSKRRKKRTSMELPRDLVETHVNSEAHITSNTTAASSPCGGTFQGSEEEMKDLRALVRGYCRQSKEDRASCVQAHAIQAQTGYPLVRPHDAERNDRRLILQLLAPVIEEMDKRKTLETEKWQGATGCRVERSRSGKYRYVSLETNHRVKSQEYQRRYRQVLEEEAGLRLERANTWKAKLVSVEKDASSKVSVDDIPSLELDLQDVMELEAMPIADAKVEVVPREETSMELCDMSVSMDLEQSHMGLEMEQTLHEIPDANSKITVSSSSSDDFDEDKNDLEEEPSLQPIQTATAEVCELRPKSVTPTEYMGTLPLPDRDVESSDPEIAEAERCLWTRIDAALQDYSFQVMTIVNSRRNAKNVPSHGCVHGETELNIMSG